MTTEAPSFAAQLAGTALALVFVLALAWGALRLLRRFQLRGAPGGGNGIAIRASVGLGARERLVAVRYRGHEYLLGVSGGGVELIDRWPVEEPLRANGR